MKVFTIENGKVTAGVVCERVLMEHPNASILGITVGEVGIGSYKEYLIMFGAEEGELVEEASMHEWKHEAKVWFEKLKSGGCDDLDHCILVMKTGMGFHGGNTHTGLPKHRNFPGRILARGIIMRGRVGKISSGEQLIVQIKEGDAFRIKRLGWLYDESPTHYYVYHAGVIHVGLPENIATIEAFNGIEPEASDLSD